MNEEWAASMRERMAWEAGRDRPPQGFPAFPGVPARRYTAPDFLELERDRIFHRSWLLAAHKDEFPERGSYRVWNKTGRPLLLVRGEDDAYRGFFNTCQHRGAKLVREESGKTKRFVCQYHAWAYDLKGQLVGVPDRSDFVGLDLSCVALKKVQCETWGNWIFVNFSSEAPSLLPWLGPVVAGMAQFSPDSLRLVNRHSVELACNWKTAVEAFLEVYHLKSIHPDTVHRLLDYKSTSISLFEGGHSEMISLKRPENPQADLSVSGVAEIPTATALARETNISYHIFPNLITPTDTTGFPFLQFWPKEQGRTEMEVSWYVFDWGEGEMPEFWNLFIEIFDRVLDEDTQNLASIHESLCSGGLEKVRVNYQERRLYHFNEEVDRVIGRDTVPEALRVESLLAPYIEKREEEVG